MPLPMGFWSPEVLRTPLRLHKSSPRQLCALGGMVI